MTIHRKAHGWIDTKAGDILIASLGIAHKDLARRCIGGTDNSMLIVRVREEVEKCLRSGSCFGY